MVVLNITVNNCTPQTIVIGRRGTYDTMQIAFDLSFLIENYGSGTAVLAVKRSQDESAYPAVVTQEDNTLTWTISETDTYYVGSGECQLMWYVDGGLAKTIIYPMVVMRDILATSEDPPDGYENWIEQLTTLGAQTQQNAEDAQAASQAIQNMGVEANGVAYDQPASVEKIVDPDTGAVTLIFDIPAGTPGGGSGGTSDYADLTNKPSINGHTLTGNQTAEQLGLATPSDIPTVPVQSVNGKTGAVVLSATDVGAKPDSYTAPVSSVNNKTGAVTLGAGDIGFSDSATYQAGSIGAEVSNQKNAIDQKQDATSYVTLSGTIVTQTGADNTMYLCGELAELTFTAPATGQTAIRFTSGTTPTVATFSGVTWLNGFDPTAIEASKTYEINILNGLGCAAWT